MNSFLVRFLTPAALILLASGAHAQISDAAGDFLPTYTGPATGDVDVISAQVIYNGSTFQLISTMNAPIVTNSGALYVWGFDRGQGTARLAAVASNVLFDSVVTVRADTSVSINRIVGGGATNLAIGTATINGSTITTTINANELPLLTPGFLSQTQYTWNLWPRIGSGNNNQISDFAPNNSNAALTSAPEGSAFLLAALGGVVGMVVRRRRG